MKKAFIPGHRLLDYLIGTILVLVPFHAFLTVFISTLIGHYTLLRLWDSIALGILGVVIAKWLWRDAHLRSQLWNTQIVRMILLYVLLMLVLGVVALLRHDVTMKALGFSLVVNLRFLVWFLGVYIVIKRTGGIELKWHKLIFYPAFIVCVFALLQFFVFSPEFLAHFGYDSLKNVAPVTTINQATHVIRVQSFLRGPNPLGAYTVLILGLILATIRFKVNNWRQWLLAGLATFTLILTFSRSAWIGACITVVGVVLLRLRDNRTRLLAASVMVALLALGGGIVFAFGQHSGVQDAFLHVSPEAKLKDTSNHGHSTALRQGVHDVIHEPFGRGPGTAGPASIYNYGHEQRNSENYFLEIGQELGWVGLTLFVSTITLVGVEFWHNRQNNLVLGLLVTLVGLCFVNMFAYAWSDDTLAYLWWGLAGIALAQTERSKHAL